MLGPAVLCYIYFLILIFLGVKYMRTEDEEVKVPFAEERYISCTGLEMVFIFLFATAPIALIPVLSLRLFMVMLFCVACIIKSPHKPEMTGPLWLMVIFLVWIVIGIFYSASPVYGVRMFLKYVAPLLFTLSAMAIVKQYEVVVKALTAYRWVAAVMTVMLLATYRSVLGMVPWNQAAMCTNTLVGAVFSFVMWRQGIDKKKNLIFFLIFFLAPFIWTFRTNVMGLGVCFATFYFFKYRVKSLPIIFGLALLAFASLFMIPSFRAKMFYKGTNENVTMTDFVKGDYDRKNLNTNTRDYMWEKVNKNIYEGHELMGSGTGSVQKYFYEDIEEGLRGGQTHSDFIVLRADNGNIGLFIFIAMYVFAVMHCAKIYWRSENRGVRNTALMAGSIMAGMFVTMYSDNSLSYSMVTFFYPWSLYGAAVSLWRKELENEPIYLCQDVWADDED